MILCQFCSIQLT